MSMPVSPLPPERQAVRRGGWYDPALRVGDAERSDIIDRLSQHYTDGRLDHAEFSDRMDRAISAKTMGDLAGLLSDLPGAPPPAIPLAGNRRHQRRVLKLQLEHQRLQLRQQLHEQRQAERQQRLHAMRWLPVFLAVLIAAIVVIHTLTHSVVAWILLALAAVAWLRHTAAGRARDRDRPSGGSGFGGG
jgi:DUF1707 SHOCT-like domain